MARGIAVAGTVGLLVLGCGGGLPTGPCDDALSGTATCAVPGWDGRSYDVVLPDAYDGTTPIPVVVAFHGGGGNRTGAARTTCGAGDIDADDCLHALGRREGFAVVYPDGTGGRGLGANLRTWNAGGGTGNWRCTSGRACEDGVDDVQFVTDLLDDLEARVAVDRSRVYATGLSNGGAISHRLGCELSDRIVAIAPVGGAMQLTTSGSCAPEHPVAVLHTHGTDDPCWRYDGGPSDCPVGQPGKDHVAVARTLEEWAAILHCDPEPTEEAVPDTDPGDGVTTVRVTWSGCDAPLVHLRMQGAGHTWPDGWPYLGKRMIGNVSRDWGDEELWRFLSAQVRE